MNWQQICKRYPSQWLLIEAIQAHSVKDQRILDDIAVVDTFPDSPSAFQHYKALHHETPLRELYVAHTTRRELEITEEVWLGVRAAS